jgi:sulfur-oxidizing protein SoxZ
MTTQRPRVRLPETAKVGEVIEIKTLVTHVMETGQRRDRDGKQIPRLILYSFRASFDGTEFFRADLQPAIAANPYLAFHFRVPGPGSFTFVWIEDGGREIREAIALAVA